MNEIDLMRVNQVLEQLVATQRQDIERLEAALDLSEEYNQQKDGEIERLRGLLEEITETDHQPHIVPSRRDVELMAADAATAGLHDYIERLEDRLRAGRGGCKILSQGDACDCGLCKREQEIERLRGLLQFVLDKAHRNAGNSVSPFAYLWQKDWDEFERQAKGGET